MSLVETVPLTLGTDTASAPAAVTAAASSILGPAFFRSSARVKVVFLFLLGFFFGLRASTQIEVVCLSLSCAVSLFEAEAEEESRQRPQLGARATSGKKKS